MLCRRGWKRRGWGWVGDEGMGAGGEGAPRKTGRVWAPNGSVTSHLQTLGRCTRTAHTPLEHTLPLILPVVLRRRCPGFPGEETEHREGGQLDQDCTALHCKPEGLNPQLDQDCTAMHCKPEGLNPSPRSALLQKQNKSTGERTIVASGDWKWPPVEGGERELGVCRQATHSKAVSCSYGLRSTRALTAQPSSGHTRSPGPLKPCQ